MTRNFFFALAITFSGFINAQTKDNETNNDSTFKFGAKAGYSLSSMKFFDNKLDSKSYFYAGLVGEQSISSKLGIQAEILYTQLGGKQNFPLLSIDNDAQIGTVQFDYQLNQIQVPISLKYYFIPNFSASAGMNVAFNISQKIKTEQIVNGSTSRNYDDIKSLNLFPFLGAEYKINDRFFVDAKYNFNFFEVNKGNLPTKIGFLQAGIGYRFN
jgi:opacity protein-like surface antigen